MTEENKKTARRYFKAYDTGNIEAVMKFIASNYVLHPGANGKTMNAAERKSDEAFFFSAFSKIETVVEDQIAEGDKVANRITMHCMHTGEYQGIPATGRRISIPYIDVARIRSGKIVEEWVEFDMQNIIRQIQTNKRLA